MIKLGEEQSLKCIKKVDFGIYVGTNEKDKVLVPKKEVPEGIKEGDMLDVFVYRDSADRLIATVKKPLIKLGGLERLTVKSVSKFGAFLDWGLDKDLFLPFKEMTEQVKEGKSYLVSLYIDKTDRLACTMKVYKLLKPFSESDQINNNLKSDKIGKTDKTDEIGKTDKIDKIGKTDKTDKTNYSDTAENASSVGEGKYAMGTVIEINKSIGAFVAIENKYYGLLQNKDIHTRLNVGDYLEFRVVKIREDGKLNLSMNKPVQEQMELDAKKIYKVIEEYDGELPYNDKAKPEIIEKDFAMSKGAFKRGVGFLLKKGVIDIDDKSIKIISSYK